MAYKGQDKEIVEIGETSSSNISEKERRRREPVVPYLGERDEDTEAEAEKEQVDTEEETEIIQYDSVEELFELMTRKFDDTSKLSIWRCLLFWYLFPKNYAFYMDDIIQLWMAQGFIQSPLTRVVKTMEDTACLLYEEFERMRVVEPSCLDSSTGRLRYKLNHSFVDLLQSQPNIYNHYYRLDDGNAYIRESTLHASLQDNFNPVTLKDLYQAEELFTLLILHKQGSHFDQIPHDLFLKLPLLKAVDLSYTSITELPRSIGNLEELRYLNLSGTLITTLPDSLCSLYQMQTLRLRGCLKLSRLPKGMTKLINLRHLDVDVSCLLVSMPPGLGNLAELQTLPAFFVGKEKGCHITELENMVNLRGTFRILRLENVSSSEEAKEAALDKKKYLNKLELHWSEIRDGIELLENLQPHTQVQELQIVGYGGAKFPSWIGKPLYSILRTITIHDCRNCDLLPSLGKLPSLETLTISDMIAVKTIDSQFSGRDTIARVRDFVRHITKRGAHNTFVAFQTLENLTFKGMPLLEEWYGIKEFDFPNLQKLNISDCPKLTALPNLSLFKRLQKLEISFCPLLKYLPNEGSPSSLQYLVILNCPLLKELYLKDEGENWGKLVPNAWIDYQQISQNEDEEKSSKGTTTPSKVRSFLSNLILKPFKSLTHKDEQKEQGLEKRASQEQNCFLYETLVSATEGFRLNIKLGDAGFGPVYKGILENGQVIAVRKLSRSSNQGDEEFMKEATLLTRVRHENVVQLLGYCVHGTKRLLVYEYLPHQSLDMFLLNSQRRKLQWERMYRAIVGLAHGLLYLHEDSHVCIIHGDIKASKILFDETWTPKIADFGMAHLFPGDQMHLDVHIASPCGYMAPEYMKHGKLSPALDVYSFGVVVLEVISGQRNSNNGQSLLEWAFKLYMEGRSLELIDAVIVSGKANTKQVLMCIYIALLCVQADPKLRPTMRQVVLILSQQSTIPEVPTNPGYSLKLMMIARSLPNLQLTLSRYCGRIFPKWVCDPLFCELTAICFDECKNCGLLPPLGQLPKLKSLKIVGIHELKMVDQVFKHLMTIELHDIAKLEGWVGVQDNDMSFLRELTIFDCPRMRTLPSLHYFRSLEKMEFESCPLLPFLSEERLPSSNKSLTIRECSELKKRCKEDEGEDWTKIEHIPYIMIDYKIVRELQA